ncbi:MAG: hypothetical protein M9921_02045 [Fimbriimonadaceae bacterium]|nr:hypothetical protein [Chthonomonadaceae bacterium]MCO5295618.1 hypothetical protein [Fimbriimonadaceae bacterium]
MSEVPPDSPQEPTGPNPEEFSPYPRSGTTGGSGSPLRPPGVYFDAIGDAIQIVKQDVGTWVVAALLLLAVSYAISIPMSFIANVVAYGALFPTPAQQMERGLFALVISFPFSLVSGAVSAVLSAGMIQMALRKIDGGPVEIGDLFSGFGQFLPMLIGNSLMSILIMIGAVFCIVPGLYVAGALAFVPILIVRQRLGGVEAINASWEVLRPFAFPMVGLLIVLGLLVVLGVIACLVGVLFAIPVYTMTLALHYRAFFPEQMAAEGHRIGAEPPRTQW